MGRNLTVHLDEATISKAKVLAARRAVSLSRLIAHEIARMVSEDDAYQSAERSALARLDRGFHLGGEVPRDRDSLHER
jgi:predicted transcriptional regulator